MFSKIAQRVTIHLGQFLKKTCSQGPLEIAKSGHTVQSSVTKTFSRTTPGRAKIMEVESELKTFTSFVVIFFQVTLKAYIGVWIYFIGTIMFDTIEVNKHWKGTQTANQSVDVVYMFSESLGNFWTALVSYFLTKAAQILVNFKSYFDNVTFKVITFRKKFGKNRLVLFQHIVSLVLCIFVATFH